MARVYSWESFIEIHKDIKNDVVWEAFIQNHGEIEGARTCFEYACADLLYHEAGSRVHWIRSAGGDGGIDVCVENDDDTFDIYQCKFFPPRLGELNSSRWQQTKESFATLVKNQGIKAKHWYLCLPRNLTERELKVFEEFKKENSNTGICIEFIEGSHLISRMQDAGIADRWFGVTTDAGSSEPVCPHQRPSLNEKKSIRRLADGLWINWATACLTKDYASALATSKADNDKDTEHQAESSVRTERLSTKMNYAETEGLLARLDAAQLRLLSVLVQGEGAVVSCEELYRRGTLMQREIQRDELMERDQMEVSMRFFRDKEGEAESNAKTAIRKLCVQANVLEKIIEETGRGFRIRLCGFGSMSAGDDSFSVEGECADNDWKRLTEGCEGDRKRAYNMAWQRRYYAEVCSSFEDRVSNAGNASEAEIDTFGDYTMIQVYGNAYVKDAASHKDALLDYIEKWYLESPAANSGRRTGTRDRKERASQRHPGDGRVMVIHGQPGDGKTTFCKKAVYAHCYEGWLRQAPQVLRFSLNPVDSNEAIVVGGKLNIPGALCLYDCLDNADYYYEPKELEKGSLIILDGYDELVASLANNEDASTFEKFYGEVCTWATKAHCNVIITSRTMCVERELNAMTRSNQSMRVVSFAPMTEEQQNLMVERMIELDRERVTGTMDDTESESDENDGRRMDLQDYYDKELPKLRVARVGKENKIRELLEIPVLFRMIAACRFKEVGGVDTKGELYSKLFHSLMKYKNRTGQEINLLAKYEKIAARIFAFSREEDTCPYDEETEGRELIYYFLTKNDNSEMRRIGFLHRAFYQYFLARRIVSGAQAVRDIGKAAFTGLCSDLCARRVSDPYVWELVADIARMKGTVKDDFGEQQIKKEHIESVLTFLNEETYLAHGILAEPDWPVGADAELRRLPAAENAVFNIVSSLAAIEKGCRDRDGISGRNDKISISGITEGTTGEGRFQEAGIAYSGYPNICELLCRGEYEKINLEGLNLRECGLEGGRFDGAVLTGAYLEGAKLNGARLAGAGFENAHLDGVHLELAMLKKAVLKGASLNGGHLDGANLQGAVLPHAHLELAHLDEADLTEADLRNAVLENATLRKTRLVRARLDHAGLQGANLRQADLRRVMMEFCSFDGTDTDEWEFGRELNADTSVKGEKTNLSEANLSGAVLRGAHLQKVHMEGADFSWADVTRAVMRDAFLIGADFHGACLVGTHLEGAHMEWASFESAVLRDAHLEAVHYAGSNMGRNVIDGTCLRGTDITGAYMSKEMCQYAETAGAVGNPLLTENGDMIQSRSLIIGETIQFGRYWQRTAEEKEPLEWRVLARKKGSVLLITERLIDCRQYHHVLANITWEYCGLRRWMNEDFIHEAFSGAELARIEWRETANPDNDLSGTKGGNATTDRVFALSIGEAKKYFKDDVDRMTAVTPYAKAKGSYSYVSSYYHQTGGGPTGWWWLRSPGRDSNSASGVLTDGGVTRLGYGVLVEGVSVRLALWLNL